MDSLFSSWVCASKGPRKSLETLTCTILQYMDKNSVSIQPGREGGSGSSWMSVLQQISHICSTSVLNSAAPVWNLPQQQQGWHQPYSSSPALRTEDYEEHNRHMELISSDSQEMQIEIKFTCSAYLPLLGNGWMAEDVFGVLPPAQKKLSSSIPLILTVVSFSVLGDTDICNNTSYFQGCRFVYVLNGISSKIIFIDTQKLKEWQKQHIPTAFIHIIHISLCA